MTTTASRVRVRRAGGWIAGPSHGSKPALRLFCLPYVGGAAWAFEPWRGGLGADVELCTVELPGRGARMREPAFSRLRPLVDALASAITGELDVPYALYGHSMGSLVAFELARELRRRGLGEPRVLFASGAPAPRLTRQRVAVHCATDAQVIERLRELGGLPEEVMAEPELLTAFLPAIRADFAVYETYEYRPERLLGCPVVVLTGRDDAEVPPAQSLPWERESTGSFEHHVLPGDHFFLRPAQEELLYLVRRALQGADR
jgi:surfactin synthase thioesterase subunit